MFSIEWYVVFGEAEDPRLRFLKPGFRHVKLIRKHSTRDLWITIEPYKAFTEVFTFDIEDFPTVENLCDSLFNGYNVIVKYETEIDLKNTVASLDYNSCVCTAKRFLGVKGWYIQTPYQLYKHLLKED